MARTVRGHLSQTDGEAVFADSGFQSRLAKAVKGILNLNEIEMDQKQWEFFKVRCLAGRHWPEVTLAMGKSWGPSWSRELQHQQLNICRAGCNILPQETQTNSSPVQCSLFW